VELYPTTEKPGDDHTSVRSKPDQKRAKACWTDKEGKFCFGKLCPGFYELICSIGSGINVTHMFIEVSRDKSANSDEPIEIVLTFGT